MAWFSDLMSLYRRLDSSGWWVPRSDASEKCGLLEVLPELSLRFERMEWERPIFLYRR